MEHGEGSEEYKAWVRHCRHCSDCQSELFILETLREDAEGERVHLPREKVAQLAMMARSRWEAAPLCHLPSKSQPLRRALAKTGSHARLMKPARPSKNLP